MMSRKVIWMYWHQGFEHANELVHECVKSWRHYNPGWELVTLDQHSVGGYIASLNIPEDKLRLLKVQHRSDLVRTKLLIEYGGVWADPTCFCVRPLDEWLPEYLRAGFFFFHKPGRDRILANWFIAASQPHDLFLTRLYESLCDYWSRYSFRNHHRNYPGMTVLLERIVNRSPGLSRLWLTPVFTRFVRLYPYMIYHYMANKLISEDKQCRQKWDLMPKVSALGPPRLQRLGLFSMMNDQIRTLIDKKDIPLFKLKWNLDMQSIADGTVLHYLFKTIR